MQQPMVWTNADALTAPGVTRSAGLEITWTAGGLANSQVEGLFSCTAQEGEGRGVLPPYAVVSGVPAGVLTVTWSSFTNFTAPGIDFGNLGAEVGVARSLSYK